MIQKSLFEFLPWESCKFEEISKANGGVYCGHKNGKGYEYCIRNSGHSIMCFDCPLGRPRMYPLRGF